MRNTIFWLWLVAMVLPAQARSDTSSYQQCTQTVRTDPSAALRIAEQWMQEKHHPSAFHCRAMALFALKRYEQAAGALEVLAEQIVTQNVVLWGNVVRQAARSWRLAGDKAKAIITLSRAIAITAERGLSEPLMGRLSAELLLDRSELYQSGGRDLFALQDLDQAISLSPENPGLLLARATLFLTQKEVALAERDYHALITLNPHYPGASDLAQQLGQR